MEDKQSEWQSYLVLQSKFRRVALTAVLLLVVGAVFYHNVEQLSWLDAFYFCTITLATIGYGDITPHTDAGKLFTIFYVLVGVGIIAAFANLLLRNAYTKRHLKNPENKTKE